MANPLTGEHDAVVQVSVGTLDRLLASMHQNEAVSYSAGPTLPHSAFVRVGDDPARRVDGVQGGARVQAGVPRLELLHLAQDRIVMSIWLRARFTPSSGSAAFPEFVYGTLRAEYGLKEIPQGPIVHNRPLYPPRFRFDVDATRVSFTSAGDTSHDAAITRQIVALLQTTFAMPAGHPMINHLMDRKVISLSVGGSQAVAFAMELFPGPVAVERPREIRNVITAGRDWAAASSRDFILSLLRPQLDALQATTITAHVQALFLSADYTITITSATVQWGMDMIASVPCGALDLTIQGKGVTGSSIAPNGTFTIQHRILLGFNAAADSLYLMPKGGPAVSSHFGGIGLVENVIEGKIESAYNSQLTNVLTTVGPQLASISEFANFLNTQLQMSDPLAEATVDSAEFTMDGVVLRGAVSVAARARGIVQFDPLPDLTGYGAFLSWFPGGRIVGYHWLWQPDPHSADVARQSLADRFVIQPDIAMPGLPTPSGGPAQGGRICLTIQGLIVDPVTGAEVDAMVDPVTGSTVPTLVTDCVSVEVPPPPLHIDIAQKFPRWRLGAHAVVEAGHAGATAQRFNTLLYHVGTTTDGPNLHIVAEAIERAGRDDAGLLVLALAPEGSSDQATARVRDTPLPGEAIARVVEDVSAEWAQALNVSDVEALRLVAPDGRLAWSHDGPIDAETLSAALREHLVPSSSPRFLPLRPETALGSPAPNAYLELSSGDRLSLAEMRGRLVTLCFALPGMDSSLEQARRLQNETNEASGFVAVILTDGDTAAAAALAGVPESNVMVVPDPHRSITDTFGVRVWPTTITINEIGVVASVTTGFHPTYELVSCLRS